MLKEDYLRYAKRAEVLKALAHPTRLFLMEELTNGERCVCELVELTEADFSTVSKHLAILKNVGLIADEKRGLKVFYRLKCPCLQSFFDGIEAVLRLKAEEHLKVLK